MLISVNFLIESDDVVPCRMTAKGKERAAWHNQVVSGAGASVLLEEYDRAEQMDLEQRQQRLDLSQSCLNIHESERNLVEESQRAHVQWGNRGRRLRGCCVGGDGCSFGDEYG